MKKHKLLISVLAALFLLCSCEAPKEEHDGTEAGISAELLSKELFSSKPLRDRAGYTERLSGSFKGELDDRLFTEYFYGCWRLDGRNYIIGYPELNPEGNHWEGWGSSEGMYETESAAVICVSDRGESSWHAVFKDEPDFMWDARLSEDGDTLVISGGYHMRVGTDIEKEPPEQGFVSAIGFQRLAQDKAHGLIEALRESLSDFTDDKGRVWSFAGSCPDRAFDERLFLLRDTESEVRFAAVFYDKAEYGEKASLNKRAAALTADTRSYRINLVLDGGKWRSERALLENDFLSYFDAKEDHISIHDGHSVIFPCGAECDDLGVFEEYFAGIWDVYSKNPEYGEDTAEYCAPVINSDVISLAYTDESPGRGLFGGGRSCAGFVVTEEAAVMDTVKDGVHEYFFAFISDPQTVFVSEGKAAGGNVILTASALSYMTRDKYALSLYNCKGVESDRFISSLGISKLEEQLGAEFSAELQRVLAQPVMDVNDTVWSYAGSVALNIDRLISCSEDRIVLAMRYTDRDSPDSFCYFRVTLERSGGWHGKSVKMFRSDPDYSPEMLTAPSYSELDRLPEEVMNGGDIRIPDSAVFTMDTDIYEKYFYGCYLIINSGNAYHVYSYNDLPEDGMGYSFGGETFFSAFGRGRRCTGFYDAGEYVVMRTENPVYDESGTVNGSETGYQVVFKGCPNTKYSSEAHRNEHEGFTALLVSLHESKVFTEFDDGEPYKVRDDMPVNELGRLKNLGEYNAALKKALFSDYTDGNGRVWRNAALLCPESGSTFGYPGGEELSLSAEFADLAEFEREGAAALYKKENLRTLIFTGFKENGEWIVKISER